MSIRPEWLAAADEAALEPDLPVCDPHHHLWDRPDSRYLASDFVADFGGHRVTSTVFVECMASYRQRGPAVLRPVGETEFVERQSADPATCATRLAAGIVGHADLLLGAAVDEVLEAHLEASPERFRGIRHAAAWHSSDAIRESHSRPPPHVLTLPAFHEGLRRLARHELVFDAWLFHSQLDELAACARACEDVTIVLDHVGGPLGIGPYAGRRDEVFDEWRTAIAALAHCPNVVVKLGGLQMPICGFGWHEEERPPSSEALADATAPWYLHCVEQFGVERCMFESNFPVDKASCSYAVLWNAFKRMTGDFSPGERAALFHDNAVRIYRLEA